VSELETPIETIEWKEIPSTLVTPAQSWSQLPETKTMDCAYHLLPILDPLRMSKTVEDTLQALSRFDYEAIVVAGYSGVTIGSILAYRTGKSLCIVRKNTENCHSSRIFEGNIAFKRYVVVDDLMASGTTFRRIIRETMRRVPDAQCIGAWLYHAEREVDHWTIDRAVREAQQELEKEMGCISQPSQL